MALRVMLFAAPLLHILVSAGACRLLTAAPSILRWPIAVVVGLPLLVWPLALDVAYAAFPGRLTATHRESIDLLRRRASADEPIYLSAGSIPAWLYYTIDWRRPDTVMLDRVAKQASYPGPAFENGVAGERDGCGDALVLRESGRTLLLGRATGMEFRSGTGIFPPDPTTGWLQDESARLRAVAGRRVWVLMGHFYGREKLFEQSIRAQGGKLRYASSGVGTAVAAYRFDAVKGEPSRRESLPRCGAE